MPRSLRSTRPILLCAALALAIGPAACESMRGALGGEVLSATDAARLGEVLAAQPPETRARYPHRHPAQTLSFFGIAPGMTVVEVLPGGGWYSKLLVPYLGAGGKLIGANYALEMAAMFPFMTAEMLEKRKNWSEDWPKEAAEWRGDDGAAVEAFVLGTLPQPIEGSVDAVLMIRALHNLSRFEPKGGFMTTALDEAYRALKPGGTLGVVQHQARDEMPDAWADGSAGYLKKAALVAKIEAAGFQFVAESDVNANALDRPTSEDIVWRLPPVLSTSRKDPALRARLEAVGESNRMTLKFRKPKV